MPMTRRRKAADPFPGALSRAKKAKAKCIIGRSEECTRPAIEAHSIPRARLRLIADKHRKVLIMTPDLDKLTAMDNSSRALEHSHALFEHRSISNRLMTAPMACAVHDQDVFCAIDNDSVDLSDPDHCLLLAYRSVLFDLHKKRAFKRLAQSRTILDSGFLPGLGMATGGVYAAEKAKSQIENELLSSTSTVTSQVEHRHYRIDVPPRLAATALIIRGRRAHLLAPQELDKISQLGLLYAPDSIWISVTVYPDRHGHVVAITFPKGLNSMASIIVPAIRAQDGREFAALLSKTLLQEAEHVVVSPAVWSSFGDAKRSRIVQHFMGFLPRVVAVSSDTPLPERTLSEIAHANEPDYLVERDPEEVNLFT